MCYVMDIAGKGVAHPHGGKIRMKLGASIGGNGRREGPAGRGSGRQGRTVGRAARPGLRSLAFAAAALWLIPLPAVTVVSFPGLGSAPAFAVGGYQPDGPARPKKSADAPGKPAEKADLGIPLNDLPPAASIELKGISPPIAELLRSGADAGALEGDWEGEPDANNIVGPIRAVAGAPWVVEPKRPPEDVIIVEGQTSQFNQAVNMGEWLDYFFNDERLEDEINYSRLRLRGNAFFQDGESVDLQPDINVKLSVPGLERRLLLFLNGDLDDGFENGEADEDRLDPEEEDNVLLGLQAFLNATRRFNVSVRGGIRFRDGSPVLFVGPRYRQLFDLDPWAMRVTAEARWFTDEGLATRTLVDFDRKFSDDLFLRITPEASWSEEEENLEYRLTARFYHRISNKTVLRYSALAKFDTDTPDLLVDARFRVAWRQKVIRDWLVVELAPEVTFPAERDYHATWGVLVRLETTFDLHMPWWNK